MTRVVVETGAKRVFAAALDWPGWCRSGRTEEQALGVLEDYRPRYASAVGAEVPGGALVVVEHLSGNATTDFGAPDAVAQADVDPIDAAEGERLAALLAAAWATLGRVAATAPEALRKGPRGGGRDRDAVLAHVTEAEASYIRAIGLSRRGLTREQWRADCLAIVRAGSDGRPLREDGKGWPLRYWLRRATWHVLDHAWEIEDRSEP